MGLFRTLKGKRLLTWIKGVRSFEWLLHNKYYNLNDLLWTIIYVFIFSSYAGFNNVLGSLVMKNASIASAFFVAFLNHAKIGILIGLFYARGIKYLCKYKHRRLYVFIFVTFTILAFLVWHIIEGTQNPLFVIIPHWIIALILANIQVSYIKKNS